VEGSGHGLLQGFVLAFTCKHRIKPQKETAKNPGFVDFVHRPEL
jgi:hypothetical protein